MAHFGSGIDVATDAERAGDAADRVRPRHDPWTVAVFADNRTGSPLGSGVVIDRHRVLTSFSVVGDPHRRRIGMWVEFPKAGLVPAQRRAVADVRTGAGSGAAILVLAGPVPAGVALAPLRRPEPLDLAGQHWWAFGFPPDRPFGDETYGTVGSPLASGHVALRTEPGRRADAGFHGAGLWSPRYQAVVGIVADDDDGSGAAGVAETLHRIAVALPDEDLGRLTAWTLPAAGESALAAWGWSLETDAEAVRHWRPRARGVTVDSERGYRFSGRAAALREIVHWLDRPQPGRNVLVVTGAPGAGKSAVLGRVVSTADAGVRAVLPPDDGNVKAGVGSVACAVHAKDKTALEVAQEVATAASTRLPDRVDDLLPALRKALVQRPGSRFNIVVDALDEAGNADEVKGITAVLLQTVQTCSDVGAQVVIGTRRTAHGVDIIDAIGPAGRVVDLDDPEYFAEADLARYALATLQLAGDERAGNPYADPAAAGAVARRIAAKADRNFLIAGLVARTHGMYDTQAADPDFAPSVDDALDRYLRRLAPVGAIPAAQVLTALAYAHGTGYSLAVWDVVLHSMQLPIHQDELALFTGSAAAGFLVEMTRDAGGPRYRLFHQALNDALLRERERRRLREHDERIITRGLLDAGRRSRWAGVDPYLLHALPMHADRTDLIDELMVDDDYLLHADLPLLASLAERVVSAEAKARARLLRLTPRAFKAGTAAERAALFGVTQAMERLGEPFGTGRPAMSYRPLWAHVGRRTEQASTESPGRGLNDMCVVRTGSHHLLANASEDWTIGLVDPATAGEHSTLRGHERQVRLVCAIPGPRGDRLASASDDGTVRVWDPATGSALVTISTTAARMCGIGGARPSLAVAGPGGIEMWDADTGRLRYRMTDAGPLVPDVGQVVRLCDAGTPGDPRVGVVLAGGEVVVLRPEAPDTAEIVPARGFRLVAACSILSDHGDRQLFGVWLDGAIAAWSSDVPGWRAVRAAPGELPGPGVRFTAAVAVPRQPLLPRGPQGPLLVLVGSDEKLYVYDTSLSIMITLASVSAKVVAIERVRIGEYVYVVTAGADGVVRLWDPATGRQERAVTDRSIRALRVFDNGDDVVVAGTEANGVRIWRLDDGTAGQAMQRGWADPQNGLDLLPGRHGDLLVSAGGQTGTINIWEVGSGRALRPLSTNGTWLDDVRVLRLGGRSVVATVEQHASIGVWDVHKRRRVSRLLAGPIRIGAGGRKVTATGLLRWRGRERLATATANGLFEVWDLGSGAALFTLPLPAGHVVTSFCQVDVDGEPLLATAGEDQRVCLLELPSGRLRAVLKGHTDVVSAVCAVPFGGRPLLMSVSVDRTVQLWDAQAAVAVLSIPVYHPAVSCAAYEKVLIVGLTAGVLAIEVGDLPAALGG